MAVVWSVVVIAVTGVSAIGLYYPSIMVARRWATGLQILRSELPRTLNAASGRFMRPFSFGLQPQSTPNKPQPRAPRPPLPGTKR